MEDNKQQAVSEKLIGTIVYLKQNAGSKSEIVAPFLYRDKDTAPLSVYVRGDNPFENNRMMTYDGRRVELSGVMNDSQTFIVDEIKSI